MGYRKLLKDYIAHVHQVTGADLVEVGVLTNAFDKRSLGELRTIIAELKRESFGGPDAGLDKGLAANANHLLYDLLSSRDLHIDELASISGMQPNTILDGTQITRERLLRIIRACGKIEATSASHNRD
ncbi:MAG: hypothetical protein AAF529_22525 [Pseudomonadota bacterium]